MKHARAIATLAWLLVASPSSAAWVLDAERDLSPLATESIYEHTWTGAAVSSAGLDVSSCEVTEASFDPSTGDASTNAEVVFFDCPLSTSLRPECRPVNFTPSAEGVFYQLGTTGRFVMAHATAATVGGDVAKARIRCTTAMVDAEVITQSLVNGLCPLIATGSFYTDLEGDCASFDPTEGDTLVNNGDLIVGTTGGAPLYYARAFDSASSVSDGILEAIAHCDDRFNGRGCAVALNSGESNSTAQIILPGGVHLIGAGGGTTSASRLNLQPPALTITTADCAGEVVGHVDNADPQCPFVSVQGSDAGIHGIHIDSSGSGVSNADITLEVMSQLSPVAVTSAGLRISDVTLSGASGSNFFLSARDGAAGAQADQMTIDQLRLLNFNVGLGPPKHQMFLDQPNTSANDCRNCVIGAALNSPIYVRFGFMNFHLGNGHNGQANFPTFATTAHVRHCKDPLSATDSTDPITCATPPNSGASILRFDGYHWEEGTNDANYGPFLVNEGTAFFKVIIEKTTLFWDWIGTFDVVSWNSPGTLTLGEDNDWLGGAAAGLGIIDIDCDTATCTNASDTTRLFVTAEQNHLEVGEAEFSEDFSDAAYVVEDPVDDNRPPIAKPSTANVTRAECQAGKITNAGASGTVTLTLPATAEPGLTCFFSLEAAQALRIDVPGATSCTPLAANCGRIKYDTNANGNYIEVDGVQGKNVALVAMAPFEWVVPSFRDADGLVEE